MARPKQLVNRQELITKAAHELFRRYGFEKTTVEDIARESGISKGAVYLEFPNKEEILLSIIRQFSEVERAKMENAIASASPPYLLGLKAMVVDQVIAIHVSATAQVHTPETMMHTVQRVKSEVGHMQAIRLYIIDFLNLAVKNEEISGSTDLPRTADLLMSCLACVMPPYPQNSTIYKDGIRDRDSIEADTSEIVSIFLKGLALPR